MAGIAGQAPDELLPPAENAGPLRMCAATRAELAPGELIRFVAAPDGTIVADLAGKLPGRGVWLTCDKSVVTSALRTGALARGLKRQVKISPNLADQIEAALQERCRNALALANKAGLVTAGFAQVDALVAAGAGAVLVHGSDAAGGGRDKLDRKFIAISREKGVKASILAPLTIDELSLALGRENVVHAALKQGGATEKFLIEAGRLIRFRPGASSTPDGSLPPLNQV